jgi:CubicO group peptidase (beta-lactamase class C family)
MSYYDFAAKTVFEPLGMKDSGFFENDVVRPGLATGYTREAAGQPWRSNIYHLSARGTSAGGAYSTVRDLLKFAHALLAGTLEPKDSPEEFRRGQRGTVMVIGGSVGVNAQIRAGLPGGYAVIAAANQDGPAAIEATGETAEILGRVAR